MRGKVIVTRRRIGKALRYLAATVTTAIGFYVLFSLLFSTEEEKRLQQENELYETYYQELREKERLVSDVVEGLEVRDDALYRRIFETEAPSVDAVTAADVISVSDSLSESFYLSYSAFKSESLRMMANNVDENFREIYRLMTRRKDSLPPLTLPLEGMSYVQTGASGGPQAQSVVQSGHPSRRPRPRRPAGECGEGRGRRPGAESHPFP